MSAQWTPQKTLALRRSLARHYYPSGVPTPALERLQDQVKTYGRWSGGEPKWASEGREEGRMWESWDWLREAAYDFGEVERLLSQNAPRDRLGFPVMLTSARGCGAEPDLQWDPVRWPEILLHEPGGVFDVRACEQLTSPHEFLVQARIILPEPKGSLARQYGAPDDLGAEGLGLGGPWHRPVEGGWLASREYRLLVVVESEGLIWRNVNLESVGLGLRTTSFILPEPPERGGVPAAAEAMVGASASAGCTASDLRQLGQRLGIPFTTGLTPRREWDLSPHREKAVELLLDAGGAAEIARRASRSEVHQTGRGNGPATWTFNTSDGPLILYWQADGPSDGISLRVPRVDGSGVLEWRTVRSFMPDVREGLDLTTPEGFREWVGLLTARLREALMGGLKKFQEG